MNNTQSNTAKKDNRRYKYGSLSIAFTVVFIALVLVVNLVFSSLSLSGDLTVDLTQEEFTAVGEESVKLLSALGKDLDVTIYFMSARDVFDLAANEYNGINLTAICRDLAENYTRIFDGSGNLGSIKVEYKELDKDPEFEKKYLEEAGTKLTSTSVIVEGKHHYRVINIASFYTVDENGQYTAFNGEYRMTSAILRASIAEKQVVTLTYGHGEPISADGTVASDSAVYELKNILTDAGFEVKTTDISREEIDKNTKILICYDPVTDFTFAEVDKISDYLSERNSFITFVDSATPALNNLQAFLRDNWGLDYKVGNRIIDNTHSINGHSYNALAKVPSVDGENKDGSAAYQIRKTVVDFEGAINTVFPESTEIVAAKANNQSYILETVLTTHNTAVAEINGISGEAGEKTLMAVSTKSGYGENNVSEYSHVMLVGSTEFANGKNLSHSYGNRRVLLSAARVFGAENVSPDITAKQFGSTALDIETGTATTLTWVICTVLPGIIMIMGFVVYFRRRHL